MSFKSPITRRAGLGGLAVAGLIAGHCLAYRLFGDAGPHAHHHESHSHLPYVLAVIVGLLIAVVGSVFDHRMGERKLSLPRTSAALLGAQLTGFVTLSVIDRVMGTTGTEIGSRAFWGGLAIQVIVAALGALVLALLRRTIEAVDDFLRASRPASRPVETNLEYPSLVEAIPSLAMATGGPSFRGPPLDR